MAIGDYFFAMPCKPTWSSKLARIATSSGSVGAAAIIPDMASSARYIQLLHVPVHLWTCPYRVVESCSTSSNTAGADIAENVNIEVNSRFIMASSPEKFFSMRIILETRLLNICEIFPPDFVN